MNENAPHTFQAHVNATAKNPSPATVSGMYESVVDFFGVTALYLDPAQPCESFEPAETNEWLHRGLAGAYAYQPFSGTDDRWPWAFVTYVEGDVTYYRFETFEDAARAGRLWAAGLI